MLSEMTNHKPIFLDVDILQTSSPNSSTRFLVFSFPSDRHGSGELNGRLTWKDANFYRGFLGDGEIIRKNLDLFKVIFYS